MHGLPVIIQYAYDDGDIHIHNFWLSTIRESIELLDFIATCEVIGFNLAFDWFHICKMRTILELARNVIGEDELPIDHIDQMAMLEEKARDGKCFKPKAAFDLMLHARQTEFQTTMERSDVRIRRVPTQLAYSLASELESRIKFDALLFARRKNKHAPKWVVHDIKRPDGSWSPDFKDIVLKFKPSVALKALAVHVLGEEDVLTFDEIEVPRRWWPFDRGYAPFALAFGRPGQWSIYTKLKKGKRARATRVDLWPAVIQHHINHWEYNVRARQYATKDVDYTRKLYKYFGSPECGDDNSELACSVAAVRWRGYAIDIPRVERLKEAAQKKVLETPTAAAAVKRWISACLSPEERATFTTTKKVVLEKMAAEADGIRCPFGPCVDCNNTGTLPGAESAKRARAVVDARMMDKEIELYDKLLQARRFHASFKVIGALSGRMAGADQLNPQGIKRTKDVREAFQLAFGGLLLRGGDFAGFEVVLAEAAYHDERLRKDLQTCENCRDVQVATLDKAVVAGQWLSPYALAKYCGIREKEDRKKAAKDGVPYVEKDYSTEKLKTFACPKCGCNKRMKIHALFGTFVYPGMTYDDIRATDGTADDKYNKCKSAVFAMIYGGEGYTLMTRLGVPIEVANEAYRLFCERYPGVAIARQRVIAAFCSIRQNGGIGSKVEWHDPKEYVESLLGFKRWFILENHIVKAIFALAEDPPEEWKKLKIRVRRRADGREQTAGGALQSALFGTSFQVQAGNMRAAANHEIQSSGAQITKYVQRRIWDLQPAGLNPWLVQPCNVHDEILCPTAPEVVEQVDDIVMEAVESFRARVPLIEFGWKPMKTWASK